MAKAKVGRMPCDSCGNEVVVKANENDTLSYRCDECDGAPYARPGTGLHAIWSQKLQRTPPAKAAPAAAPAVKPEQPAPAAKPVENIWGL